ncbi:D-alanine--D-alanine ligase [Psychrobium sp. 1_MG-2023]|uniref:D-alanine--D-alanine ligase n=1 Tax=Psychrobium sp. 1_MG-2023 TaxID=3062624 RepID=UPI000C3276DA|nr:D-alanine--D-alanine ligase [Psychrobium sp. 1_MG-2023]MDP2561464.1 D-alanine--D-alanine ligase [Psychrobium sp. 1_MG-2023]PKF57731.1 D-alanine--D-alanine ligase [Alteromonadales bacterium alter-6D02]
MSDFGKVAVMFGGTSAERDVSLMSGQAVLKSLLAQGIDAHAFDPKEQQLSQLQCQGFDRVFNVLHGRGGEDGTIQGALELLNMPYTGSGVLGAALAMDKIKTKQVWTALGMPTAKFVVVDAEHPVTDYQTVLDSLGGTVMVKPSNEGSSIGMAKVSSAKDLEQAITDAIEFDSEVLLEQWIEGGEYTVAILGEKALPAIHMTTPHDFYDYQAKYQSNDTQYHCPCGLAQSDEQELLNIALKAFKAVNARGWGRVDFMRDEQGQWYLLEVNTVPGMTETSLVPKAAKQAGLNFEQLVVAVLSQTLEK